MKGLLLAALVILAVPVRADSPVSFAVWQKTDDDAIALAQGGASVSVDDVRIGLQFGKFKFVLWALEHENLDAFGLTDLLAQVARGDALTRNVASMVDGDPDPRVIPALIKAGADPNGPDKRPRVTALWLAASAYGDDYHPRLARDLIACKVDLNRRSGQDGETALMAAIREGHIDLVEDLIDAGADVNVADRLGRTAIFTAAEAGDARSLKKLLKAGADPAVKDEDGKTALEAAHGDEARDLLQRPEIYASAKPAKAAKADKRAVTAAPKPAEPAGQASSVDEPAYSNAPDEKKFALVVGIAKYKDIPEAEFAEQDAAAVRAHLRALGYPERNIISLSGENASKSGLEKYLEAWLPRNIKADSRLFVYFSGHGAPDPRTGKAYLVPWDADPKFLETTGYPLDKFYRELGSLKAKSVIVALDSCFSGAGGRSVLAKGMRPLVTRLAGEKPATGNIVVLAAASGEEITGTAEGESHGLFTFHLLSGLNAKKGKATAGGLFEYLKTRVEDDARRDNREQSPQLLARPGEAAAFPL